MIRTEIKRNIFSIWFIVAVVLMYALLMVGDSGDVLSNGSSTTVVSAIWEKLHGDWCTCIDSTVLGRMYGIWTDSSYLPILAPLFCSLPAILRYRDEAESGSKRFIIARGTLRRYYASKFIGGIISAALIMLIAVMAYDVTLLAFYDRLPVTEVEFQVTYSLFTGTVPESAGDVSWPLLAARIIKSRAYFCLYAVMGSALCILFSALFRSRYTVFGGIILVCYVHDRFYQELQRIYSNTLKPWLLTALDVIDPEFLRSAGDFGFYATREWLALIVAAA